MADQKDLSDLSGAALFTGFILGLIISAAVGICALASCHDKWRREAVEKGAAEWVIDDRLTGHSVWRWKVDARPPAVDHGKEK